MPQHDELFDIKTAYEVVKNSPGARKGAEGMAFYDKLLQSYGPSAILVFLKKTRPLLQGNIDFETKHLGSRENVIFSLLEENHYPYKYRSIFRFLDFKVWGIVGLGFFIESTLHLGESALKEAGYAQLADKIHKPLDYITIIALYFCSMAIMYEFYEKSVEHKILNQIELISNLLLAVVPKEMLDAIPDLTMSTSTTANRQGETSQPFVVH